MYNQNIWIVGGGVLKTKDQKSLKKANIGIK